MNPQGYPQSGYPQAQVGMQPGLQNVQYGQPGQPYPGGPGGYQPQQGYPGGQPGGYPGGQPGGYPGGQPGYPGGQPGGYPGGQPGGYPGGQPGGYPGGQPGGYPGGQPGMYPGGPRPGVVVGQVVSVYQQPTTFQVRKNFFVGGGEMDIMQNNNPIFRCISMPSPLGYGHAFNLTDMAGNSLCYIQPDMSAGMPHFHIYLRGNLYATLKQDWRQDEKKFELHNKQTGEQVKVYGDWFAQNFEFQRHHGGQVAQVSSGYGGGEFYNVTVFPGEDALFILAAALTIEKLCHEHKHHHRHNW